jgi:hypothetical protein
MLQPFVGRIRDRVGTVVAKGEETLRMNANEPLTEEVVKQLILTCWKMQEEKAHLVDLMAATPPTTPC